MQNVIEIAWAAGLFEGEGSCFIGSGQRQPRVSLQMTDEDAVRRFHAAIGRGNVRAYEPVGNQHKATWQWSVQSKDDVLFVLALLWPYLGDRRREAAAEVIERAAKMNDGRGFCKRGHDLSDPAHCYIHRKTGKRSCRTCRVAATSRFKARRRVPRPAA